LYILSLFDGMACGSVAFTKLGVPIDRYVAYEIDKYAVKAASHNFPFIEQRGDVFQADFTEFAGFDWVIGGSPCTYWSIAQKNNRETEASGIGWELFQQYVRAVHEAKPKFFLYENNKSMSKEIRASIDKAFGFEAIGINSALVSAQNRQRLYWVGIRQEDGTYRKAEIEQPEDRGILLRDVLDSAVAWQEKGYALTTRCQGAIPEDTLTKHRHTMVAEPVRIGTIESNLQNPDHDSKQYRVYSPDGKSTTICGQGGGVGAKTGLYACPADGKKVQIYEVRNGFITIKDKQYPIKLVDGFYIIRKLTVSECMRLQTVPEWYDFSVISNSQAYKCLGNGWTVDVICHLMKSAMEDSNVQLDEHTALRDALALIETT
jgi:DNA (cytosine-5)-methyltransferase 3A